MSRSRVMRRRIMVLRAWMRIEGAKSKKEKRRSRPHWIDRLEEKTQGDLPSED